MDNVASRGGSAKRGVASIVLHAPCNTSPVVVFFVCLLFS